MNELLTIVGISSEVVGVAIILTSKVQVQFCNLNNLSKKSKVVSQKHFIQNCFVVLFECDGFVAKSLDISVARKCLEARLLHPIRHQASRRREKRLEKCVADEKVSAYVREQFPTNIPLVCRAV